MALEDGEFLTFECRVRSTEHLHTYIVQEPGEPIHVLSDSVPGLADVHVGLAGAT